MAGQQAKPLVIAGLRGRDGSTVSVGVPPERGGIPWNKCVEALNVDWYRASFARKRGGSTALALTFASGGPFTGQIGSLATHMPSSVRSADELWAMDSAFVFGRLAGGTTWTQPTQTDAATHQYVSAASLNGKLFVAHNSNIDRAHVWDGTSVRRTGLAAPTAGPTVANTGAGAYAATARYYKARMAVLSGTTPLRLGEASASQVFTPSGAGTAARVTRPATVEDATHWRVEVSLDDSVYYVLSGWIAIATTTYDDSAATTSYSSNDAAPLVGQYTNWPAVTYFTTDDNRLIGAGSWGGATLVNRVYFSPVMGTTSSSFSDEEYLPNTVAQKNYVDIDSRDGGFITGLSRPFLGAIYVFKDAQIHKLINTGIPESPYRRLQVFGQRSIGCLRHDTIIHAIDENGQPALYWLSHVGPYRITSAGMQFLGDDIQDIWDTVNLDVCYGGTGVPHGVYHAAKHQIWWWIPTSGSTTPNKLLVYDTRLGRADEGDRVRGGWSVYSGLIAGAHCSAMFAATVGASMSSDQKPYVGRSSGTTILKADTADTSDNGTAFQALVTLPERHAATIGNAVAVTGAAALGSAGSHTLTMTITADYGAQSRTSSATFTAAGTETRKLLPFEGTALNDDAKSFSVQIGDGAAAATSWTIDALLLHIEGGAQVVQA